MSRASSGSGIEDEHGWVPMGHLSPVSVTGSVEEEIVGDREELDSPSTQEAKEDFLVSPKATPARSRPDAGLLFAQAGIDSNDIVEEIAGETFSLGGERVVVCADICADLS